jgi:hypothetical protein
VREVGAWLDRYGECIYDTDMFTYGLMSREGHNGDWSHNGPFTLKGKSLYQIVKCWPGSELVIAGLNAEVQHVTLLGQGGPAIMHVHTGSWQGPGHGSSRHASRSNLPRRPLRLSRGSGNVSGRGDENSPCAAPSL